MSSSTAAVLPVGFRFRPTDEELVRHYLKAKIAGRAHPDLLVIPDVDLATCEPWDLPARSVIKSDDPEWFFFASREAPKYPGRHRSNRSTAAGYWKATGKDRLIRSNNTLIGIKKTLVFHRGRAPRGQRTAWIMHEYRTTEPQFEAGQNGSFVLYRLFNKNEDETPGSNSESPSTSSPRNNPQNDLQAATATTSPSDLSQLTATEIATDDAGHSMTHLLTTVDDQGQKDTFLDVLAELPDLQLEQRYDEFPNISSPMRPYTDHPFVGNIGEQDFSAYFDSIIAEQDLQELLINPTYAETDKHLAGNAEPNPTAQMLLAQRADATRSTSGNNTVQTDTGDDNHETRAQINMVYSQYQHMPVFDPQMESQNSGALCSTSSWAPYLQRSFNAMADSSRSEVINSNAFDEQEGPPMQQFTVPEFMDPQQGTAARRVRLVYAVQRASASQPILASYLESEDEAGSCCSTGSSSNINSEEYVDAASQTMSADLIHVQGIEHTATEVVSSVEVTDKLQHLSFTEDVLPHTKLLGGGNLKQRLKQEFAQSTQNGLLQNSNHVPGEPSLETRRLHAPSGSVVRLLWLALLVMVPLLVLLGVWGKGR